MRRPIPNKATPRTPHRLDFEALEDRCLLTALGSAHDDATHQATRIVEQSLVREAASPKVQLNDSLIRGSTDAKFSDVKGRGHSDAVDPLQGQYRYTFGQDSAEDSRGAVVAEPVLASVASRITQSVIQISVVTFGDDPAIGRLVAALRIVSAHQIATNLRVVSAHLRNPLIVIAAPDETGNQRDADAFNSVDSDDTAAQRARPVVINTHDRDPVSEFSNTPMTGRVFERAGTGPVLIRQTFTDIAPPVALVRVADKAAKRVREDAMASDEVCVFACDVTMAAPQMRPQCGENSHKARANALDTRPIIAQLSSNQPTEPAVNDISAAPAQGFISGAILIPDLSTIEQGVEAFLDQVEVIGDEITESLSEMNVPAWLTVVAVSAVVGQVVWLRLRPKGAGSIFSSQNGRSRSWLPDSISTPREDIL